MMLVGPKITKDAQCTDLNKMKIRKKACNKQYIGHKRRNESIIISLIND